MIPSANIVPALGPPMSLIRIFTSTGSVKVGSTSTPIRLRPWSSPVVLTGRSIGVPARSTCSVSGLPGGIASTARLRSENEPSVALFSPTRTSPTCTTPRAPVPSAVPATVSFVGTV
jgi:hypothetical protein